MPTLLDPETVEPLDPYEGCDEAYGQYHIGRDDETRSEYAFVFDVGQLTHSDFLERELVAEVRSQDGRVRTMSEFERSEPGFAKLRKSFAAHGHTAQSHALAGPADIAVVIVELKPGQIDGLDHSLRAYTAYHGYGDVSWPSHFRTLVTERQVFL